MLVKSVVKKGCFWLWLSVWGYLCSLLGFRRAQAADLDRFLMILRLPKAPKWVPKFVNLGLILCCGGWAACGRCLACIWEMLLLRIGFQNVAKVL